MQWGQRREAPGLTNFGHGSMNFFMPKTKCVMPRPGSHPSIGQGGCSSMGIDEDEVHGPRYQCVLSGTNQVPAMGSPMLRMFQVKCGRVKG